MNNRIGILDSGIGGLSILIELRKVLPHEDYLFYEDSINNPYGSKSGAELLKIVSNIVDFLLEKECKIIVIACNTATTACIKELRKMYPNTIFVGTVPAIKVAYDGNYKNTVLLSTPYTMNSKRVNELINDYHNANQKIINVSGEDLANLIELDETDKIDELLDRLLNSYKECDSVVLGCTHYPLIKDRIKRVVPHAELLDGSLGVANEVKHQLTINNLLNTKSTLGDIEIVNSKDKSLVDRSFEILNNWRYI
ncbi:MAG: glutamate racemase [Bacilli bacterium]|nr:glutamate racemase [Bacilli bacterium]